MTAAAVTTKDTGRSLTDWSLFALLTLIWAGAYPMTRVAVGKGETAGLPPEWVLPGRLVIGALVLWAVLLATGKRPPPLSERRTWLFIVGMGIVGSVIPFFFITTAQETVNSSLAALYASASPVFVALGANLLFREEKLTLGTGTGMALGFLGIIVLFGPEAMKGAGNATLVAQCFLLIATMGYAGSTLIARGAPPVEPIVFAASYATVSAAVSLPLVFLVDPSTVDADWTNWAGVLGLGFGSSGLAQILYMLVIVRAGATFLSLTGYAIPLVSAALGFVFFRETQSWNALAAFALILGGVWLARRGGKGRAG